MFSKWENTQWNTERRWKSVRNTMILEFPFTGGGSNDNNIIMSSQYWSLWGDKMTLLHLMIDNATLRCRDERQGNGKSLDFTMVKGSKIFSSRIKTGASCEKLWITVRSFFIPGHYLHTDNYFRWKYLKYYFWACVHQTNTHPAGTERSESRAFDSHVVGKK